MSLKSIAPQQGVAVNLQVVSVAALLVIAILLGGGGVGNGLGNMVVQLTALGVLAANFKSVRKYVSSAPTSLHLLIMLSIALVVLQLVPLPSGLWQAMPRRDLVEASFTLAGKDANTWTTISVQRARTATAFVGILTPLAAIILFAALERKDLGLTLKILVGIGIACALVGFIQITTGNARALIHGPGKNATVLHAFFANRNSAAIFFDLIFLAICVVPLSSHKLASNILRTLAAALAALAVIFTQSRSGNVLLILTFLFAIPCAIFQRDTSARRRPESARFIVPLILVVGIGAAAVVSTFYSGRTASTVMRFEDLTDSRPRIWEDASFTALSLLPLGSGMGTFDEVFQLDESLEYIMVPTAGRAHNDYLELLIEGGIPAMVLLAGWLSWVGASAWQCRHSSLRWLGWASAFGLLLIALQSMVDYPLRNQTLFCVAGILVGVLANPLIRARSANNVSKDVKA